MEIERPIVLASASPRRRAFLAGAGLELTVSPADIDESARPGESAPDYVVRMAAEKSAAVLHPGHCTIASDTIVVLDGEVLGKPGDPEEASAMLLRLSGRVHTVLTSWVVEGPSHMAGVGQADVRFRTLNAAEIAAYVDSGAPFDKAGGYGIQGDAGDFVDAVDGDYDAIVGLPVSEVLSALELLGAVRFRSTIERRAACVRGRIAAAVQGANRNPDDVRLVAVSKGHPVEAAAEAIACGLRDLGENYAQSMRDKAMALAEDARWHFIGGVQRNKAAMIAAHSSLVHGVDSVRVGEALAKRATDTPIPVLVQVNLAGEASKGGVTPSALPDCLARLRDLDGLSIRGMMTLPPAGSRASSRRYFGQLAKLRDAQDDSASLAELSMGMSGDFEQAISKGATLVRVGTAIFGRRER